MIRVFIFVVACGALCLSCGNLGPASPAESNDTNVESKSKLSQAESPKPVEDSAAVSETLFTGEALMSSGKEGEASPATKVDLRLTESDRLSGSLTLEGKPVALEGLMDGESLRLWALGGEGDDDVRRGFLFAKARGSRFEGDLSISGNGGEPVFTGTWWVTRQSL